MRDSDYAGFTWFPEVPALDTWRALYRRVARSGGGEPDAGRRLLSWARAAGFTDIAPGGSAWCYATPEERAWWSGLWADRTTRSAYARLAVDGGHATPEELAEVAEGWREWGAARTAGSWCRTANSSAGHRVHGPRRGTRATGAGGAEGGASGP